MKTTLEIPDTIARQIKARSALKGITMRDFVLDAIRDKLGMESKAKSGWKAVFGKAPRGSLDEVRETIDREFNRINPDEWR
jgi:hypothetical protein